MRITDLTLPIEEHWRYPVKYEFVCSHANHDRWQARKFALQSHWFTHIDAPLHHDPKGPSLDAYPIKDWCYTRCLVLDLSYVGDNEAISAEMLEKANEKHKGEHFDSLLIRSDRGKKVPWTTVEFWDNSCYLTKDAGEWIRDYKPKVVGYDFPQDYEIRLIRKVGPKDPIYQPVHDVVLKEGRILQIEYMTNLWDIGHDTCTLVALPLNLTNADGAQIRCIAITDD